MVDIAELERIKYALIGEWDRRSTPQQDEEPSDTWLESLPVQKPPRGGFAVGHAIDPASREPVLEIRVHAAKGPDYLRAVQLQQAAELQGVRALLRVFARAPAVGGKRIVPDSRVPNFGGRRNPLHIGASVAHEHGNAGTLGAFVEIAGGRVGIISCAHVLARGFRTRVRQGDPIQQPGLPEEAIPYNRIGELSDYFGICVPSKSDILDAAVAELGGEIEKLGNVIPDAPCIPLEFRGRAIGEPLPRDEIEPNIRVIKVGRTTGLTRGVTLAVDFENFRPNLGRESFTFGRVHEIGWLPGEQPYSERGDSGSLVMTEAGLNPIGLHFCAVPLQDGSWRSYVVPWDCIAERWPIRLLK